MDVAVQLEAAALKDEYFVTRNLYPNVDFYTGIVLRAMDIPVSMFTVLFAVSALRSVVTAPASSCDPSRQPA